MSKQQTVDYSIKTQMPIRDMHRDGRIVFWVDIYGLEARDLCIVPGGSRPMQRAVERLGLDPNRYHAVFWDVMHELPDKASRHPRQR